MEESLISEQRAPPLPQGCPAGSGEEQGLKSPVWDSAGALCWLTGGDLEIFIWSCPQKAQVMGLRASLLPFKVLLHSSALCCLTPVAATRLSFKCLPIVLHAFHSHPLSVIPPLHHQLLSLTSPSPTGL